MGVATMAELIAIVLATFATNFLCQLTVLHSRIVDSLYLNSSPITVAIMPGDETEGVWGAVTPPALKTCHFAGQNDRTEYFCRQGRRKSSKSGGGHMHSGGTLTFEKGQLCNLNMGTLYWLSVGARAPVPPVPTSMSARQFA